MTHPSSLLQLAVLCLSLALPLQATEPEKASAVRSLTTATFYISDVKCAACVSFLENSIRTVPGVQEIDGLTEISGYARVSFDPKKANHHQIAQAVSDTLQLHGEPFIASLKLLVPDYAKDDNAGKIDTLFAQQKDFITVVCSNRAKGLFQIRFQPQPQAGGKSSKQAWDLEQLLAAIKALGLSARLMEEK
ncbi:MAG: heavy-metal-associated domain-containing protein [Verrucomicrobiota bacterium]